MIETIISYISPPTDLQARVTKCVKECRIGFPKGRFGDDDGFPAILKTIANVEVGVSANQRDAQLQSDSHQSTVDSLYDEVEIKKRRKTALSALYDSLINVEFKCLIIQ